MLFFNFRVTVNLKKKKSMSEKYVTLPNLISVVFYTEKTSESDFDCDFVFQNPDL